MKEKVSIDSVVEAVSGELIFKGKHDSVRWVVSSGLMSDVLTTEEDEILLLSSLTSPQVVRTADMVEANAILIACGKPIAADTIDLAKSLNITILRTNYPVFEACNKLGNLFLKD